MKKASDKREEIERYFRGAIHRVQTIARSVENRLRNVIDSARKAEVEVEQDSAWPQKPSEPSKTTK
jgi:hypothetical protein